jgi:hypothetical protein
MTRQSPVRRLLHWLGIDRAVGFTLLGQFWNIASGPLLLILIVSRLTGNERGVLFNYVDITQFQYLFELGTGAVIQQLASRERAFLAPNADGTLGGDPKAKARLAVLLRIGLLWFAAVAIVANVVIFPAGWYNFASSDGTAGVDWKLGWVLTVAVAAVEGVVLSLLLFLSGCGHVAAVARVTAVKAMVSTAAMAVCLLLNARLLAHPISGAAGLAVSVSWLLLTRRRLLLDLWQTRGGEADFRWRTDIWPFQWRVSFSWLCMMAVVRMLGPLTMRLQGAAAAGQVGLSMYILMTIQGIGGEWVRTKVPSFGLLAAQKKWAELDHIFRAAIVRTLVLVAVLSLLLTLAVVALYGWDGSAPQHWALDVVGERLADRVEEIVHAGADALLPPMALALLALATVAMHVIFTEQQYLRAHGREPMVLVTVTLAVVVLATLLLTGKFATVTAMIAGYSFWILTLGLGGGTYVFQKMRRRWHRPDSSLAI